jgi:hypothetical protein
VPVRACLTLAKGEIFVLNSADYGPVTINKAVSIASEEPAASILATSGAAITISAGASDASVIFPKSAEANFDPNQISWTTLLQQTVQTIRIGRASCPRHWHGLHWFAAGLAELEVSAHGSPNDSNPAPCLPIWSTIRKRSSVARQPVSLINTSKSPASMVAISAP